MTCAFCSQVTEQEGHQASPPVGSVLGLRSPTASPCPICSPWPGSQLGLCPREGSRAPAFNHHTSDQGPRGASMALYCLKHTELFCSLPFFFCSLMFKSLFIIILSTSSPVKVGTESSSANSNNLCLK